MTYADLLYLSVPAVLVVVTAFAVLLVDMLELRNKPLRTRMRACALLSAAGCLAAVGATLFFVQIGQRINPPDGMFVVDALTLLVQQVILMLTVFTALLSVESTFTDHVGEYFLLLLLATAGMMFLVSTENVLLIFVSLELLSLCLYVMTAFNKRNLQSAEAALKYFLVGGTSAAFMLFGLSLLYGLSGSIHLQEIAARLKGARLDPLLIVAIVMVLAGFGFKVAAVPFHLWAPDAYQGAPTPSAVFIASGSKVASFFVLAKVLLLGFAGAEGSGAWRKFAQGWMPILAVIAVLSMLLGNLAAIAQTSVRRLLAYSAVAHAGYALLALFAGHERAFASLLYYVFTYALTALGAFGVVSVVQERAGEDQLSVFAGLSRRAPLLAFCMMIFMLSLAGIPPLAGFFGKFYVFAVAAGAGPKSLGLLWLVIFAIAMSAVSLYYYLQVLKQIYIRPAPDGAVALPASKLAQGAIALLALGVLVLGCAPNLLLQNLTEAIKAAGF